MRVGGDFLIVVHEKGVKCKTRWAVCLVDDVAMSEFSVLARALNRYPAVKL